MGATLMTASVVPVVTALISAVAPVTQVVQTGRTGSLSISNDGYVAAVDGESALHLWDLNSRSLLRTIPRSQLEGAEGLVQPVYPAWDEATSQVLLLRGSSTVVTVDLEGRIGSRAIGGDLPQVTRLWTIPGKHTARWITKGAAKADVRAADWRKLGELEDSESLAVTPDGSAVLVLTGTGLDHFSLDPLRKIRTIPLPGSSVPDRESLAVNNDGSSAAVCMKKGERAQVSLIRHLDTTPIVVPLDFPEMFGCRVAISTDHGMVVAASAGEMRGYDLATASKRWVVPLHYGDVETAGLALAGRTVVVGWRGLEIHDLLRGDVIAELGAEVPVPSGAWFLGKNSLLATRPIRNSIFDDLNPVRLMQLFTGLAQWSLSSGTLVRRGAADWGYRFALHEDGTLWTARPPSSNAGLPCWTFSRGSTADGAAVGTIEHKSWPPRPSVSKSLCLDEKEGSVMGVDVAQGALATFRNGRYTLSGVGRRPLSLQDAPTVAMELSFSPDGQWVVGGNLKGGWGTLYVWSTTTGRRQSFTASARDPEGIVIGAPQPRKGYNAFAFSRDSKLIAVAGSDVVTVYTIRDKRAKTTVSVPSDKFITAVAFQPNGSLVLGTNDGTLIVTHGNTLSGMTASTGSAIESVQVRSDGARASTVSVDGAVRLWNIKRAKLLATFVEFGDGETIASTPGGAYAGSREAAERIKWVFDGPVEGFSFERFAAPLSRPDVVARRLRDSTSDIAVRIGRPPRVAFSGSVPTEIQTSTVHLKAHVEGTSKINALRAFVSGRPSTSIAVNARSADVQIDVALEAGTNVVTLVAFDDEGRASNPLSREIVAPSDPAVRPDIWVVAAGVGSYPRMLPKDQLEGAVNDAFAIADAFAAQAGPGKLYASAHVATLVDENVTSAALTQELDRLARMKPSDVAVVFLAGHGERVASRDMVLLTSGASRDPSTWSSAGIGWATVGNSLRAARGRVIVLLDACHAGDITREPVVPNSSLADNLVGAQRAGVLVFAASKGQQVSLEENVARGLVLDDEQRALVKHQRTTKALSRSAPPPTVAVPSTLAPQRRGNGYFTGAVVAALDSPATDVNANGVLETSELVTQVQLRVSKASRGRQTPWVPHRELFGDFVIARASRSTQAAR